MVSEEDQYNSEHQPAHDLADDKCDANIVTSAFDVHVLQENPVSFQKQFVLRWCVAVSNNFVSLTWCQVAYLIQPEIH